jgi:hypothetical protein
MVTICVVDVVATPVATTAPFRVRTGCFEAL